MRASRSVVQLLPVLSLLLMPAYAQVPLKPQLAETRESADLPETPAYQLLNINNITIWGKNNGTFGRPPIASDSGSTYPRGTASVFYWDEFVWGGKMFLDAAKSIPARRQAIRVGGGSFAAATRPGRIIGSGSTALPADTNGADVRYYRIRRDFTRMSQDELRRDAAESYRVPTTTVTQGQMDAVRNQYGKDWKEWPVAQGAPYIERNGIPGYQTPPPFSATFTVDSLLVGKYDEPGIAGSTTSSPADQVMWCVFNDLDPLRTNNIFRCDPIGLELQVTTWGYKRSGALGEVFFRRLRLINKGGVDTTAAGTGLKGAFTIDSMYVACHADIEIGTGSNDLAGCDSAAGLSYIYNGTGPDGIFASFNLPPPAIGYEILQGPRVPSAADTALFDMKKLRGWKNLHMSSAMKWASGDPYSEPHGTSYGVVTGRWWKVLRGYLPLDSLGATDRLWINGPNSPSKFPLNGDPVNGTGWIDGVGNMWSFVEGDQRIIPAVGPFALAPGDTQEVVLAIAGGLGADRLSSIAVMKANALIAKTMHQSLYSLSSAPDLHVDVYYPDSANATLKIACDGSTARLADATISLATPGGQVIQSAKLVDDGAHGDSAANDGIFGVMVTIARQDSGLTMNLSGRDIFGNVFSVPTAMEFITTAGPLEISAPVIFSDNLDGDGIAEPGENIRFGFALRNTTRVPLTDVRVSYRLDTQPGKTLTLAKIGAAQSVSLTSDLGYFSITIPQSFKDSVFTIPLVAFDRRSNRWNLKTSFNVVQITKPYQYSALTHVSGRADGDFSIRVVNPLGIRNHLYVIQGTGDIDTGYTPGITVRDSTDGRVLLAPGQIPDTSGHYPPVLDGFKLLRGTIPDFRAVGLKAWSVPSGQLRLSWVNGTGYLRNARQDEFFGAIAWDDPYYRSLPTSRKGVGPSALRNVLIRFAATDTAGNVLNPSDPNWSFGYRYLRNSSVPPANSSFTPFMKNTGSGYVFQEYVRNIPFSAWDVDTIPSRRLMVGFLENNVASGSVDGKYWPPASTDGTDNTSTTGPREWFFIFDVPYSEIVDSRLTKDMLSNSLPVMWWGTPTRNGPTAFQSADQFLVQATHIITSSDRWIFNPTILVGIPEIGMPLAFDLAQNYPNPFNPSTTIEFTVPSTMDVTLRVYNLLGQEVVSLVEGKLTAGKYRMNWDGRNNLGTNVSTGVYFYRLVAADRIETRKMLLLR